MGYQIAIDGPAGAGKSTIAKLLAKKKGFVYVDTGAMYRGLAYYFLSRGIQPQEEAAIAKACNDVSIDIAYENGIQQIYVNHVNVTCHLREEAVLPDADLKIFLTASVDTRARRRYNELLEKGESCDYEKIASDIEERDRRDMTRDISPLCQAEDARLVDSSDMPIEEVVETIESFCRESE